MSAVKYHVYLSWLAIFSYRAVIIETLLKSGPEIVATISGSNTEDLVDSAITSFSPTQDITGLRQVWYYNTLCIKLIRIMKFKKKTTHQCI